MNPTGTFPAPDMAASKGHLSDQELRTFILGELAEPVHYQFFLWQTIDDLGLGLLPTALDPVIYSEAQIFGADGELRWRREVWADGAGNLQVGWRVVFIGSPSLCPGGLDETRRSLDGTQKEERNIWLWGEQTQNLSVWLEPRIPRKFEYPVTGAHHRVQMSLIEYQQDGRVAFNRLIEVT